jgi:hypothetical protein
MQGIFTFMKRGVRPTTHLWLSLYMGVRALLARNPLRLGELVGAWTSRMEIRMDREIKSREYHPRGRPWSTALQDSSGRR